MAFAAAFPSLFYVAYLTNLEDKIMFFAWKLLLFYLHEVLYDTTFFFLKV